MHINHVVIKGALSGGFRMNCGASEVAVSRLYFLCLSSGQSSDVDDDKWEVMELCELLILLGNKKEKALLV